MLSALEGVRIGRRPLRVVRMPFLACCWKNQRQGWLSPGHLNISVLVLFLSDTYLFMVLTRDSSVVILFFFF